VRNISYIIGVSRVVRAGGGFPVLCLGLPTCVSPIPWGAQHGRATESRRTAGKHAQLGPTALEQPATTTHGESMHLDELRELLTTSSAADWHTLSGRGNEHTAAYRANLRVTIEWGMDASELAKEMTNALTPWASSFSDSSVDPTLLQVFYCGSLVDRYRCAYVDGHRAILPQPRLMATPPDRENYAPGGEALLWSVARRSVEVVRLIDEMTHESDYDHYLSLAEFYIDERW